MAGILTTTNTLTVTTDVTISGPGAAVLAVSGQGTHTVFAVPSGVAATLSGLTIQDGHGSETDRIGDSGVGGGIYSAGTLRVASVVLTGNSASYGGGIESDGSQSGAATLSVTASTLANNTASVDGGGIFSDGFSGTATLSVTASTLAGNSATDGGGIFSDGFSGGMATLSVTASTLANNTARFYGGGIESDGYAGTATLTATNTLLAGGSGGACFLQFTCLTDAGGNLDDDGTCGFSTANGSITDATTPGLGTLGSYGGPTLTIPLLPGSQALGLGVPAGCTANGGLDQRGVARPATGCDSGAFQATLPITPSLLPAGTVDSGYTQPLSLTDGQVPVTYTSSPALPAPGLSLGGSSGVLAGTPTTAGTYPFTVTALDAVGEAGSQPYTLTIQRAPTSLTLSAPALTNLGQSIPVTATLTAPTSPTAPTGTVVFTLTSNLGTTSVLTGTLTGLQAGVTFPSQGGAASYSLTAGYSGDANFLPSGTGLGAGSITQLGCAVSGSVLDRGVGSLSIAHLQVPASGPGQVTGSVAGVLTVNQPVLAAGLTGGSSQSATITGTAGGSSAFFRPGTRLSVQLAVSGGQATATIRGSSGQTVVLVGAAGSSRFGLSISAV